MAVSNGQTANATSFNNAFVSKTQDSTTVGRISLENTNPASGANVTNVQREVNSLNSFTGRPAASAHDATPSWTNTDVGASNDDLKTRVDLLTAKFNAALGHTHSGAPGDAPPVSGEAIDTPLRGFVTQGVNLTGVTGGTHDISALFLTKLVSTNSTEAGVPVAPPYNKVLLRYATSIDPVEDSFGNQVYGRLTNIGGVGGTWTMTFFSDVAGTETAYSFVGSNDLAWWYQELMHPFSPSRPVYSEDFFFPSDNLVADMPDAAAAQAGKVSTGPQVFGGEKNFFDGFATEHVNVASSATISALSSAKSFVRITGATATSLEGISAPASGKSKRLVIFNASSALLTIEHDDAGALAANRIITPEATAIEVESNSSIELIYDTVQSRWVVVSSGVGGGDTSLGYQEQIGTGNGVATSFGPLTNTPLDEDSIIVALDGGIQNKSLWSLSGSNIVFGSAPSAGQAIYVYYLYSGTPPPPFSPSGIEQVEYRTITGGEATAKNLTLVATPANASKVKVDAIGGSAQEYGVDFTVSGSTLDWSGYGLDGVLGAGDKLRICYWS